MAETTRPCPSIWAKRSAWLSVFASNALRASLKSSDGPLEGRMPFPTLVIFNPLATTILRHFGFGEAGARTTAGSIDAALPCSMLRWSTDWALLGRLIVASIIIASFNLGFGSVDAIDVSGRMAADVAQDTTVSQICEKGIT